MASAWQVHGNCMATAWQSHGKCTASAWQVHDKWQHRGSLLPGRQGLRPGMAAGSAASSATASIVSVLAVRFASEHYLANKFVSRVAAVCGMSAGPVMGSAETAVRATGVTPAVAVAVAAEAARA